MHFKHLPGRYDGTILKQGVIYESCKAKKSTIRKGRIQMCKLMDAKKKRLHIFHEKMRGIVRSIYVQRTKT